MPKKKSPLLPIEVCQARYQKLWEYLLTPPSDEDGEDDDPPAQAQSEEIR